MICLLCCPGKKRKKGDDDDDDDDDKQEDGLCSAVTCVPVRARAMPPVSSVHEKCSFWLYEGRT